MPGGLSWYSQSRGFILESAELSLEMGRVQIIQDF